MSVPNLYNKFREKFPGPTSKADKIHIERWGGIDPEIAYLWFEDLAAAFNREMELSVDVIEYAESFEYLSEVYEIGDEKEKDCIDVSFVENLFWNVPSSKAKPYWNVLPVNLKNLYMDFHRKSPVDNV